ncbi:MAG TPA: hypothetical protein VFF39_01395 [Verrucomicrobiae bacterium]|nr:hypothetical protein [Verrucomicrobiae bacterium]
MEDVNGGQPAGTKRSLTDGEKKDQRERDNLKLSRAYVVQQIEASSNEKYKESLQQALQEIDQKLAKLGSSR